MASHVQRSAPCPRAARVSVWSAASECQVFRSRRRSDWLLGLLRGVAQHGTYMGAIYECVQYDVDVEIG